VLDAAVNAVCCIPNHAVRNPPGCAHRSRVTKWPLVASVPVTRHVLSVGACSIQVILSPCDTNEIRWADGQPTGPLPRITALGDNIKSNTKTSVHVGSPSVFCSTPAADQAASTPTNPLDPPRKSDVGSLSDLQVPHWHSPHCSANSPTYSYLAWVVLQLVPLCFDSGHASYVSKIVIHVPLLSISACRRSGPVDFADCCNYALLYERSCAFNVPP